MFVQKPLTCVEICAGAGGQALGLAMAGFVHVALVEYEADYCNTLKQNRPEWNVICADVRNFDGKPYEGVDLLAGGVPCPPFSIAGKQLGKDDERDLFPAAKTKMLIVHINFFFIVTLFFLSYLYISRHSRSPLSSALTNNSAVARFVASGILCTSHKCITLKISGS